MKKILAFIAAALLGLSAGLQSYAQNGYKIQAIVVDDLGPIAGAGVLEKGTSNGTATDLDGAFTLTASSADAQIEISFVGYATLRSRSMLLRFRPRSNWPRTISTWKMPW